MPDAEVALSVWGRSFVLLSLLHYGLGVSGAIAATAVAAKTPLLTEHHLSLLAWVSAACIALLTLLAPLKRAKLYHSAWNHLGDVYRRYRYNNGMNTNDVNDALKAGEDIVGKFFDF